jgi:hypothetical protein
MHTIDSIAFFSSLFDGSYYSGETAARHLIVPPSNRRPLPFGKRFFFDLHDAIRWQIASRGLCSIENRKEGRLQNG